MSISIDLKSFNYWSILEHNQYSFVTLFKFKFLFLQTQNIL